jgi:transcriptional regulator with XRE-family HTH domain
MSIYNNIMNRIKLARERKRLSQRALAKKAALSFKGLQLMEKQGHDSKLSSLQKLATALGLPAGGIERVVHDFFSLHPDSIQAAALRIREDGFESWPLHLMNFVDAFRVTKDVTLVQSAPTYGLDARLSALLASTVEFLCMEQELSIPGWCAGVEPLGDPWFVSGMESLKATALMESPVYFRKRNIFVMADFLDRV